MSEVRDYAAVTSLEEAQILADKLLGDGKDIGFDVETGYFGEPFAKRALDTCHEAQFVVGFSITNDASWARYIPLRHDNSDANLPPREVWRIFRPVLENLTVIAHHKKFEDKNLLMLAAHGDSDAPIRTKVGHDSMLDSYVLGRWREQGLKFLSEEILGVKQMTLSELFEIELGDALTADAMKKIRFNVLPVTPAVISYACDDAALCLALHDYFMELMEKEPERRRFILRLEERISHLMADMELEGVSVDWDGLEKSYASFPKFSENFLASVREEFSYYTETDMSTLNFNSPDQMRTLLYTNMGLSVTRMTKNKNNPQPSTDATALAVLSKENPAVQKLLKYREVKVMGTRHKKWITESSHAADKRAHASYNQVRVPTGRFSASDPAIQQIPKIWFWSAEPSVTYDKKNGLSNPEGKINGEDFWMGNFRNFIKAADGKYFLTYDVSQGELRVLAGVSQEKRLIEAYQNGEDVHTLTAAMMLDKEPESIEDSERQIGKALPLDERVLTPHGFVRMGEVVVGTVVTTPTGTAKVEEILPGGRRRAFEVKTTDGGITRADKNHLWETSTGLKETRELEVGDAIPTAVWEPVDPYQSTVDPYTLGVILAAASLGATDIELDVRHTDTNIINIIDLPEGVSYRLKRTTPTRDLYVLSGSPDKLRTRKNAGAEALWSNPLEECLRSLGLRTAYIPETRRRGGVHADSKYIPQALFSLSAKDRMNFLRGMVDARGYYNNGRSAEVSFTSRRLALDFQRLVWSLGGRAKFSGTRFQLQRRSSRQNFTIIFTTPQTPFKNPFYAHKWSPGSVMRTIESVRPLRREFMQCIRLDDGKGLFVAGDYMVTHNCQPLDSLIHTPEGWKTMGDMHVGSLISDPQGTVQKVTGVFPQGVRDAYKVVTNDGSVAESDLEHYWPLKDRLDPDKGYQRITLGDVMDAGLYQSNGLDRWEFPEVLQFSGFTRTLKSVVFSRKVHQQCISVSAEHMQYITNSYIPTMNTMNFALLYQMGEKALGETLAISSDRASELYANYFKQFSSVTYWMDDARRLGKSLGYAETFLGRKMPLWGYDSAVRGVRSAAERASVNYPIQGGLADIVKIIMVRSYEALKEAGLWGNGVMMVMNQHDALTFEVDNSLDPVYVRGLLEKAADLRFNKFPNFVIDWEIGKRWGSSEKWDDEPVYQDSDGEWHVGSGDTVVEEKKPLEVSEEPVETYTEEPVLVGKPELHVVLERLPAKEILQEFFTLVKRHPGDSEVTLLAPGVKYVLPLKTSLSVNDAPRISLTLQGAVVRVPENSASLAAIAADLEIGEV